ncbi:ribosome biogenesis protein [Vulcanisaeta souniana]|uniref:Ribosomal RNA small subunit methyltransferase Nep1 n=1 Tax=Vulcanisaeta souniana JCM 11219 TaxID=1293586 RepID=A0A830EIU8_9CREN|nr:ribosome biogenesis protein [Vulcanisaeta souniana]BDR91128.1 ribosome biogenesis protein [Vulcanisaeta souniana JCM 11219]GGI81069.1 ribosome biogenesis protein [Vulcanisaeta souniana JCM 11219]
MKELVILLAESALETIPRELLNDPVIINDARKRRENPRYLILDRARHHRAMLGLPRAEKRGRPDIVHQALLLIQGSILAYNKLVKTYIHTTNNLVIYVDPETRVPRNYNNFIGLMSQLFREGKVPPMGKPLFSIVGGINHAFNAELPDRKILLDDVRGREIPMSVFIDYVLSLKKPLVMIGAFPRGSFEESTYSLADDVFRISRYVMDTATILCRLLSALEMRLGLLA